MFKSIRQYSFLLWIIVIFTLSSCIQGLKTGIPEKNEKPQCYKLTEGSLASMDEGGVSKSTVDKLISLKDQEFTSKNDFNKALKEKIGWWRITPSIYEYAEKECQPRSSSLPQEEKSKTYLMGRSVKGRPIHMVEIGSGKDVTLVIASVQGDKKAGRLLVKELEKHLRNSMNLLHGRKVLLIATVNPDGMYNNTPKNANGVYLNRNFPGGYTYLQPETKAVKKVIEKWVKPETKKRIVNVMQFQSIDYDGPLREKKIAYQMEKYCDLKVKDLRVSPGSLGNYAGLQLEIPTITLGLHRDADKFDSRQLWKRYGKTLMAAILYPSHPREFVPKQPIVSPALPAPEKTVTRIKRLAMVIGNSDYTSLGSLANPVNDARAMTNTLKDLDFDVMEYENLNKKRMKRAIRDFGRKLKDYDVGLFFFAGHGMQVEGYNYLIPTDAPNLNNEDDVQDECVSVGKVFGQMEPADNKANIVILDACRDAPIGKSWTRSATSRGLASMTPPPKMLIAYATSPGKTAPDGREGENSPYTNALLRHMRTPNISVLQLFQRVRKTVMIMTDNRQTPWESTSLIEDFYFSLDKKQR